METIEETLAPKEEEPEVQQEEPLVSLHAL